MLRLMIQYLNLPLGAVPAVSVEPHDDVEQPPHHMRTISERGNRQPGVKGAVAFVQREQEPRQAQLDVSDADITSPHVIEETLQPPLILHRHSNHPFVGLCPTQSTDWDTRG